MVAGSAVGLPLEVGNDEGHLRERNRFPLPAGGSAGASAVRGTCSRCQRRLRLGYSPSERGHPSPRPDGSHDRPVRVDRSNNNSTLNTAHPSQPVPDRCATVVND